MLVASLLDVVRDQQHDGATSPTQSGTPLKIEEPHIYTCTRTTLKRVNLS